MPIAPYTYGGAQPGSSPSAGGRMKPFAYAEQEAKKGVPATFQNGAREMKPGEVWTPPEEKKEPGIFSKLWDTLTHVEPKGDIVTPTGAKELLQGGADVLGGAIKQAGERNVKAIEEWRDPTKSKLDASISTAQAGLGVVSSLFAGVTAPLTVISRVPVVGYVGDAINNLFGALGVAGGEAGKLVADHLPFVSEETEQKLIPLAEELGALTAQIVGGHYSAKMLPGKKAELEAKAKEFVEITGKDVPPKDPPPGATPEIRVEETPAEKVYMDPSIAPKEIPIEGLVDSTGKHDIRTVMTGLEKGGYSKGQIGAIMGKVIGENNTGRFTPKEISDVAREMIPDNKPAFKSTATIKENVDFGKKQGEIFSSPNVKEDLSFEQAQAALISPEHVSMRKTYQDILRKEKVDATVEDAIGDWADGAENTTVTVSKNFESYEHLRSVAAQLGIASKQKAVIPFMVDKAGKDVLYTIDVPGKVPSAVREGLTKHGIQFRTLATIEGGTRVKIFDQGATLAENVKSFNKEYGTKATKISGTGEFLGGNTRAEGATAYEGAIRQHRGRDGSTSRRGDDNRNVETKPAAEAPRVHETEPIPPRKDGEFDSMVFARMKAEHPSLEGELGYDPIKLKEEAEKAVDLIEVDKQRAYKVAMGTEVSADITSTAVNIAMAEKALKDGNHELYATLIRNRSLAQTRRGQEIVSERGSITDNSTSRYVKELVAARLENLGKGYLSDVRLKKVSDKTKASEKLDSEVKAVEEQIRSKKMNTKTALQLLDKLACI